MRRQSANWPPSTQWANNRSVRTLLSCVIDRHSVAAVISAFCCPKVCRAMIIVIIIIGRCRKIESGRAHATASGDRTRTIAGRASYAHIKIEPASGQRPVGRDNEPKQLNCLSGARVHARAHDRAVFRPLRSGPVRSGRIRSGPVESLSHRRAHALRGALIV